MTPFLTVPFSFSENSFNWLQNFCEPIVADYQKNAPLNSALVSLSGSQVTAIMESQAWQEIVTHSNKYNLTDPWPQLFIYKQLDHPCPSSKGNPHIDTYGPGGIAYTAAIRFNVLLRGEDTTEMVWWDRDRLSKCMITQVFQRPDLTVTGRVQVVGSTVEERWQALGEPAHRATHLAAVQEHASFVRTDVAHALNWTGNQPRVVFSIRYKEAWQAMEEFIC
ncbi:hypothetical protein UFOVP71_151 [uncultured Caudovirales phage]|uniref:Uncharacterized protein n=1 Tax=uncultured Caudovirales phage TaxID=2100421 RepID=A0A6J5T9Z7_9CAUD|nr:hypothetical protein UFOVP71_151 [uncultured Caudovirales phage]